MPCASRKEAWSLETPFQSFDAVFATAFFSLVCWHRYFCDQHQFNDMASLTFNPLEKSIKELFHYDGNFSWHTCTIFFMALAVTSCWTCVGTLAPSLPRCLDGLQPQGLRAPKCLEPLSPPLPSTPHTV